MNTTISEALSLGIDTARQCKLHKKNQEKAVEALKVWFQKAGIVLWQDVTVDHIRQYVASLEARQLTPNTIRAYTNPLRLAHRATRKEISTEYLKLRDLLPARQTPPKMFLTAPQLMKALELADRKAHHRGFYALALGAMAGLRITEAIRIQPEDYDPDTRQLTIGASHKERKNWHSGRVVPLCKGAAGVLQWHIAVKTKEGKQTTYCDITSISRSIRAILDNAAQVTGNDVYNIVKPREAGRKTFMNLLHDLEVDDKYIRAYCGQAPERWDTMSRHYLALTPRPGDIEHVKDAAMEKLNRHVITPLNNFF